MMLLIINYLSLLSTLSVNLSEKLLKIDYLLEYTRYCGIFHKSNMPLRFTTILIWK